MSKITSKTYGITALVGIAIVIVIELLVVMKILPFDVIVGGTIPSYEVAAMVAIANIVVLIFLCAVICIAAGLWNNHKLLRVSRGLLIAFTVYFAINIILNMMGKTWLERILGGILAFVEIGCYIGILIKKRK